MTPALAVEGLSVSYDQLPVVFDVDLRVPKGSVVALLGPNGAGKTTTLRACAGLVKPSSGRVLLHGQEVGSKRTFSRSRNGLCLIPEGRGIFPSLTVKENLLMHRHLRRRGTGGNEEAAYLRFPALAERRNQVAGTLSGGEQQMLALSRALTTEPSVLLLDEISMGLAPMIVESLFEVVSKLRDEGLSILIVEQRVENAMKLADYVALMYKGTIRAVGEPEDVEDLVARTYFGVERAVEGLAEQPPSTHGSGFVRTERGSVRHLPDCIVVRASGQQVVAVGGSDLPMCGMCDASTGEPATADKIGAL